MRDLLEEQTATLGRVADLLERQEQRLAARERREIQAELSKAERPDRPPQHPLRKLSFATMAKAVPGFMQQFKPVPEDFWMHLEPGGARVNCPCGKHPALSWAEIHQCECERFYVLLNKGVYVAGSPGQWSPEEAQPEVAQPRS